MNKLIIIAIAVMIVVAGYILITADTGGPQIFDVSDNNNDVKNWEDENGAEQPDEGEDESEDESGEEQLPVGSAQVIRTVTTNDKVVVLTFDAGSDRGFASQILDTLKQEGIKASFGMTGKWAQENPDIVRRISQEGHDFINHTWSHASFTGFSTQAAPLTREQQWAELSSTEDLIKELTGVSTKPFFRPPYGDYNTEVNSNIFAQGYNYNIMWTVDSLGWRGLTKEEITERVVAGTVPGAIHLFHVGEQSQDAAALPLIIDELRAQGYRFARVSDLL